MMNQKDWLCRGLNFYLGWPFENILQASEAATRCLRRWLGNENWNQSAGRAFPFAVVTQ
jgi:hypothetical protein